MILLKQINKKLILWNNLLHIEYYYAHFIKNF